MIVDLSVVVVEDLLKVLTHKDKVDTTEAQLGDAKEYINNSSGSFGQRSEPGTARSCKACFGHIRICQEGKVGSPAKLM